MARLFQALILGFSSLLMAASTAADVVDTVRFAQAPVLMVWSDGETPQIGSEVSLGSTLRPAATQTFPGAGQLDPIQAIGQASPRQQSFRIASNTGFRIRAAALSPMETSFSPITVSIRFPGENADRSIVRSVTSAMTLSDLIEPQVLQSIPLKTAGKAGTPESQSVEIQIDWGELPRGEIAVSVEAISE